MSKKIDQVVDCWIDYLIKEDAINSQVSDHERKEVKNSLREKALDDIKKEVKAILTEDEKKRILAVAKVKAFISLLIDGLIVAFVVGLLVNQFTNIIDLFTHDIVWRIIIVIIGLLLLIFIVIQVRIVGHIFQKEGK